MFGLVWTLNLHFTTKLEDPREEGGAEGDFGGEEEVGIVDRAGGN